MRGKKRKPGSKDGTIVVPVYVFTDGRFCVDTMVEKTRKRITRTSFDAAKLAARKRINQIASGRTHEVPLTLAQTECCRSAVLKNCAIQCLPFDPSGGLECRLRRGFRPQPQTGTRGNFRSGASHLRTRKVAPVVWPTHSGIEQKTACNGKPAMDCG